MAQPTMRTEARFADRAEAGRELASALREYRGRDDVVVLALPRGGVPVGFEVARELGVPLDVFVVRKLGLPAQPELAMGAIASGGVQVLNQEVVQTLGVPASTIEEVAAREQEELDRREQLYRGDRPGHSVEGKTIILVDDGVATGSTMRAAVKAVRMQHPGEIVVAIPVAPPETCEALRKDADRVVCIRTPEPFLALGAWYASFVQTPDAEIQDLLARAQEDARRGD